MNVRLLITAAFCALTFASCGDNGNDDDDNNNTARVNFRLTDDPASYDNVFVDIQSVEVTMEGSSAVTLTPVMPGVYDLLRFRNGLDTLLVSATLPAGKVSQIRLKLGPNNSVVVDGQSYALTTPSGQTSGVKLNLNETFAAGGSYTVWIDFDAGKSVVQTGNGKYILKPVVRAYTALTNGKIVGTALPLNALVTVYAVNGVDSFSAIPNVLTGAYVMAGLPAGTYSVTLDADSVTGFLDTTVTNVNVTFGATTNLGTITLHP